jgi:hypothetical protein
MQLTSNLGPVGQVRDILLGPPCRNTNYINTEAHLLEYVGSDLNYQWPIDRYCHR